jgi:hypothetical protein
MTRIRILIQNPEYPNETILDRTYHQTSAGVILADMNGHGVALHGRAYRACVDADAVDNMEYGQIGTLRVSSATGLRLDHKTRAKLRGDAYLDFAIYMECVK